MLTITSRENPQIKQVCGLLSASRNRRAEGLFVCEGFTLLEEALRSGCVPESVFCLDSQLSRLPALSCPVRAVTEGVLRKLSDVPAPQGVVFTLPIPPRRETLSGRLPTTAQAQCRSTSVTLRLHGSSRAAYRGTESAVSCCRSCWGEGSSMSKMALCGDEYRDGAQRTEPRVSAF